MEELVLRFPLVSQEIFKNLDNQDLTKFKEVSRFLKNYLKNDKSIWIRRLKKYNGNHVLHKETWISFMKNEPVEKIETFVISVEQFYTKGRRIEYQHSPLHIVAECGNLLFFKYFAEKNKLINPSRDDGLTPFHFASQEGHVDICSYIIGNLDDKNPKDNKGNTPLHKAAQNGRLDVCKLIIENIVDKNPSNNDGLTPLHRASTKGSVMTVVEFHSVADEIQYIFSSK